MLLKVPWVKEHPVYLNICLLTGGPMTKWIFTFSTITKIHYLSHKNYLWALKIPRKIMGVDWSIWSNLYYWHFAPLSTDFELKIWTHLIFEFPAAYYFRILRTLMQMQIHITLDNNFTKQKQWHCSMIWMTCTVSTTTETIFGVACSFLAVSDIKNMWHYNVGMPFLDMAQH